MSSALVGYRKLLRTIDKVFKNDIFAINEAKKQIKNEFNKNKSLTNEIDINKYVRDIDEVDEMLRFHIVQGQLNDKGRYAVELSTEHLVTVEASQNEPQGPTLEVVDKSINGEGVIVNNTSSKKSNS